MIGTSRIITGDVRTCLRELPAESVQTCITSPPYFGLRDYGAEGQIGLEPTLDEYVEAIVEVFRDVRRVLRNDGTVWLNLGDSFVKGQLAGMPWRVALAMQADGWLLRSDVIWHKPNPMPESVRNRPTKAHEYLFLFAKRTGYFYDADAIREPHKPSSIARNAYGQSAASCRDVAVSREQAAGSKLNARGANKRTVWTIAPRPFTGAHFAVFPPDLVEPCVLAGTSPQACADCGSPWKRIVKRTKMEIAPSERVLTRDADEARTATSGTMTKPPTAETVGWEPTCVHADDSGRSIVLDPFAGAGTTGMVALKHGRQFVGIELNPEYAEMARSRIVEAVA